MCTLRELDSIEEYLDNLSVELRNTRLSVIERLIVQNHSRTYKEISDMMQSSPAEATLKVNGQKFFAWLSEATQTKVRKAGFRAFCLNLLDELSAIPVPSEQVDPPLDSFDTLIGNIPVNINQFYGRQEELKQLEQTINQTNTLVLTGVEGVGKKSLLGAYLREHASLYNKVVWQTLYPATDMVSTTCQMLALESRHELQHELSVSDSQRPYLFIFDGLETVVDGYHELSPEHAQFFELLQRRNKLILISTKTFNLMFPFWNQALRGLSPEDAMCILQEFGVTDSWWIEIVQSLNGIPRLIRQYVSWSTAAHLDSENRALLRRPTVQLGVVESWLNNLFSSEAYSEEERQLLLYIAQSKEGLMYGDILQKFPKMGARLSHLISAGILDQVQIVRRGKKPQGEQKPRYRISGVLQKYIVENFR